jgi:hypothetical protein
MSYGVAVRNGVGLGIGSSAALLKKVYVPPAPVVTAFSPGFNGDFGKP